MYSIILRKKVIKFINSRTPKDKNRIKAKFLELENNPYPTNEKADIKKLQGRIGFRLRVGSYRFIYEVVDTELIIYMEEADNRGDIY
ncbi:MAG: type II toxin-antitoxin system RelE/ParE family toxin [Epsilonproteobacteria bacterium]|nr:type II toxin-antitoxin system RelE/ParE family toxin [Campylobacterota bacterium]